MVDPSKNEAIALASIQIKGAKIARSNLLNKRYIQYAAGPTIGALYYSAITFDGLLK